MAEDLIDLLKSINPAEAKLIGSSESYDDPIFTKEDLATAKDKLTLLARYLLIQEKVGFKKYNELYDKYVAEFGIDPVKANRDRGNYRKTLRQPSMTYKFFTNNKGFSNTIRFFLNSILKINAKRRTVTQ